MPAQITFESYVHRPTEEFISQPKLNNLMKILKTIHNQEQDHPENPYLTLQQIRSVTFLQPNQMTAAMNQRGMKVLFDGKGIAFGLSNLGRQVVDGGYQLNLAGIVKFKTNKTINDYVQPLTREEFAELTDKDKADIRKVNKYVSELLIKHLSPSFEADGSAKELIIARGIIFEVQRTLTKLITPRHPNAHELAQQINTAKPTITQASPDRVKESLDQANVSA